MYVRYCFLFSFLVVALSSSVYAKEAGVQENMFVMSGVILNKGSAESINRFVSYVEKESGYKLKPYFVDSYDNLSIFLKTNKNALAWTCGAPYVKDSIKDAQQLIAVPLFKNKPLYRSFLITKKGRSEKSLLDFAGQVFAYSDSYSNSGMIAPSYQLKKEGIDINEYFRLMMLAGNHEQSIESVLVGLADVAAVDEYIWVEYSKVNPDVLEKLTVLNKFGPFPFTPIVAGNNVSKNNIKILQEVFVNMSNTTEGKELLHSMGLDGFVIKQPDFFEPIKKMIETIHGPIEVGK